MRVLILVMANAMAYLVTARLLSGFAAADPILTGAVAVIYAILVVIVGIPLIAPLRSLIEWTDSDEKLRPVVERLGLRVAVVPAFALALVFSLFALSLDDAMFPRESRHHPFMEILAGVLLAAIHAGLVSLADPVTEADG